jgi:hypothetical protein
MWYTRREIGGVIYLTGAISLAIGSRLVPAMVDSAIGGLFLIYTLVGAAIIYRSLDRRLPSWQAAGLTIGMGVIVFLFFYLLAGLFTTAV